MSGDVLEVLYRKLDEEVKLTGAALGGGSAKSFEEYKYTVGVVRGLHIAQAFIQALATQMEQDDD